MLAKKMKKACALTVAMMLAVSGALVGALADDYEVEIVDVGETQSTTSTESQQSNDAAAADTTQPAQSSSETTTDSGDIVEVVTEKDMHRVVFYAQNGEELTGVDIRDGDYIIEPENEPFAAQGEMFLFWYDDSELLLTPYVFGTAVTKSINLRPYYVSLPQAGDTAQTVTLTPEQTTQVVQEIINAHQIISDLPQTQEQKTMTPEEVIQVVDDILVANREASGQTAQPENQPDSNAQVMTDDQTNAIIDDILTQSKAETEGQDNAQTPVQNDVKQAEQDQAAIIEDIFASQMPADEPTQTPTATPTEQAVTTEDLTNSIIDEILGNAEDEVELVENETEAEPEQTEQPAAIDESTGTTNPQSLIDAILAGQDINELGADAQGVNVDLGQQEAIAPSDDTQSSQTETTPETATETPATGTEDQPKEQENVAMTNDQVDNLIADIIGDMLQPPPAAGDDTAITDTQETEGEPTETDGESDLTEEETDEPSGEEEPGEETGEETEGTEEEGEVTDETGEEEAGEEEGSTEEEPGEETGEETEGTEGEGEVTDETGEEETGEEEGSTEEEPGEETGEETEGTEEEGEVTDETGEEEGEEVLDETGEEEVGDGEVTDETTEEGEEPGEDELGEEEPTEGEENQPEPEPTAVPNDYRYDTSRMGVDVTMAAEREGEPVPEGEVVFGDTIVMRGYPRNPDGVPFTMQWQRDKGDGWEAIAGETGQNYSFIVTEENVSWDYRLVLVVDQPGEDEEADEAAETDEAGENSEEESQADAPVVDESIAEPVNEAEIVEGSTTE